MNVMIGIIRIAWEGKKDFMLFLSIPKSVQSLRKVILKKMKERKRKEEGKDHTFKFSVLEWAEKWLYLCKSQWRLFNTEHR